MFNHSLILSKAFINIFAALGGMFFLSACSSAYIPNVPNTPMLSAKGELNADAHITLKGNTSFNSAYAVADHIGILLNGSIMNSERKNKDFKHNLLETGAGYFTTFGAENNRILEVYTGFGSGNSDRTFRNETSAGITSDRQEAKFGKWFAQVNYSSKDKGDFKLFGKTFPISYGTALRISYVNMKDFTRNGIAQPTEDNIFLEPVFFTRYRIFPAVQLQYTSGSNFGLKKREFLTAGNSVLSFGIVVNVGGKQSD
ncbi:MAG: hypothetical protein K0S09_241 [Sphingobacteriaceae bacterium]|jgi:hypothetical protein|nr:hypothetical protein [Sphingobacteriaceae bacterium]